MKRISIFLALIGAAFGAPTTPINNATLQVAGINQTGMVQANGTSVMAPVTASQFSTAMDLLGSTRGSLLYRGASGWTILTPGTAGSALESGGAGADPIWGSGSTGTVTSFSAGNLSPLFTTNVATATTTPALTFTLNNAAINTVYAGATSGSPAPPTFRSLVTADLPAGVGDVVGPASATSSAFALWNGTTGKLLKDSPMGFTLASTVLGVPDGFQLNSAGTIDFHAGGSNKSITLTPSGSGVTTTGNQITSTVTTGTAPFVVASTTLVSNLHAATADSAPVSGLTGLGTGVATALGVNVGTAGAFVVNDGTGVTAVSVATANGLAGSSSGGSTPALTLSTTITGILKGNGTAISAAASGTDYAPATTSAFVLTGNSAGGFTNTDMTYATPILSAPNAFNISGAGSISLTAGSTAKDVTFKSSTTGNIVANAGAATPLTAPRFQGFQVASLQDVSTSIYLDAIGTQSPRFVGRRAKNTLASLGGVVNNDALAQFVAEGYGATGYVNVRPGMVISAAETWSDTAAGTFINIGSTLAGTVSAYNTVRIDSAGRFIVGGAGAKSVPAWGVVGTIFSSSTQAGAGFTVTDNSSPTGTVASAVFNSFAAPTINATNASVVYTDLFNLYAVAPLTTGNASATRKHTFGIVDSTSAASSITGGLVISAALGTTATSTGIGGGNINTGGTLTTGGTATINTAVIDGSAATTFTGGAGNMTITAGTGNSRTLALQSTTSGGAATTFLTGNADQSINLANKITTYNGIATAGNGVASIQGAGRVTAQSAAAASVATYTVGASDASFLVSANVLVTASVTNSFTATCAYTDEASNARTLTLTFSNVGGTFLTTITNVTGTGAYEGIPLHIRAKASTAITIATTGTFTSVTYNAEGIISKLQ